MPIGNFARIHEEKIDLARACIEHRATWMALIYGGMEERGLDAEEITRTAIRKCGAFHATAIRERCDNPQDLRDFYDAFLTEHSKKYFEMEVVEEDEGVLRLEFHYCPLVSAWQKLGLPEDRMVLLCDIAMEGDRGIAESLGLRLDLTDTIAGGCDTCKLRFHRGAP